METKKAFACALVVALAADAIVAGGPCEPGRDWCQVEHRHHPHLPEAPTGTATPWTANMVSTGTVSSAGVGGISRPAAGLQITLN